MSCGCRKMWQDMDYTPFMQQLTQLTSSGNARPAHVRGPKDPSRSLRGCAIPVPRCATFLLRILCTFNYYCIILHLFTLILCKGSASVNDEELLSAVACHNCRRQAESSHQRPHFRAFNDNKLSQPIGRCFIKEPSKCWEISPCAKSGPKELLMLKYKT